MTNLPKHAASWFSIPSTDLEKSVKFYEDLIGVTLIHETMGEGDQAMPYAMFPKEEEFGVTGAVTPAVNIKPASGGVVVYLVCSDIDGSLGRVESLGGSILMPKMPLPDGMGDIAVIADLEGTPVGLHQM